MDMWPKPTPPETAYEYLLPPVYKTGP
ncbi:hypothetical protein A2U01_0095855, partial [Trifolium medium]|nr:hypothetical protein [Trifolium medium]